MTPTTQALAAYRPSDEEKIWGLIAHLSPLVALFLGPLLVLVIKGNDSRWVRAHAIESLNFSITLFIGYLISGALMMVFIGFCTMLALAGFGLIVHILGAVKAYQGGAYHYPFALRLIKD